MTVTPQQKISKTPLKHLTFTFGEIMFNVGFWGEKAYSRGLSEILGFLEFPFLLLGGEVWGSVGPGGPVGVFENIKH